MRRNPHWVRGPNILAAPVFLAGQCLLASHCLPHLLTGPLVPFQIHGVARVALIGRRTLRTRNRIVQKVDGPKNRTWLDSAWGPFLSTHQAMTLLVSEEPICTRLRKQSSEPRRSMRLHSPAVLRVESREDSHSHQPHSLSPILNAHLKGCLRRGPFITRIECPYQRVFQNWRLATASQKISTVTGLPAWYTLVTPYMHSMTAKPIDKNSAA